MQPKKNKFVQTFNNFCSFLPQTFLKAHGPYCRKLSLNQWRVYQHSITGYSQRSISTNVSKCCDFLTGRKECLVHHIMKTNTRVHCHISTKIFGLWDYFNLMASTDLEKLFCFFKSKESYVKIKREQCSLCVMTECFLYRGSKLELMVIGNFLQNF